MSLAKLYLEIMDKANQAQDRQTYFYYLKQAGQLLYHGSSQQYGIKKVCENSGDQYEADAA